jgi:hypothetical protein
MRCRDTEPCQNGDRQQAMGQFPGDRMRQFPAVHLTHGQRVKPDNRIVITHEDRRDGKVFLLILERLCMQPVIDSGLPGGKCSTRVVLGESLPGESIRQTNRVHDSPRMMRPSFF